jgi:hypothetical protein
MLGHSLMYFVKFSDALRENADQPRITRMANEAEKKEQMGTKAKNVVHPPVRVIGSFRRS